MTDKSREINDNVRKGIEKTFERLERSVALCDKDIISDVISIGRQFADLDTKDLDRLRILTDRWHRECKCIKR